MRGGCGGGERSGKGRSRAGAWRIYRHHRDLQLHGDDHAARPGRTDDGACGNGSFTESHELLYGGHWRNIYRCNTGAIQLFHVPGNPVLREIQCGVSVREPLVLSDTLQNLCPNHAVCRRTAGVHGGVGSRRRGCRSHDRVQPDSAVPAVRGGTAGAEGV